MVQFANWTQSIRLGTNPDNISGFPNVHWQVNATSDEGEGAFVWPFDFTDWKGFKVIAWTQNERGTIHMTRRLNGVDVGTDFTFTSPPSEPPFVPTIFTDFLTVPLLKSDVISYRIQDSNRGGADMWMTLWSFMEFPDGLWGF